MAGTPVRSAGTIRATRLKENESMSQAKLNAGELLNPESTTPRIAIPAMPLCVRHCRLSPEKLIERPIANLFIARIALMAASQHEAGFVIFNVPEIHHFPAAAPRQTDLFGRLSV